jgi:hypothetical protein
VLAFLDGLCSALLARNPDEIHRYLCHPLARALPRQVREEAMTIARAGKRGFVAPMHALRLYHQTAHLLGACTDPATRNRGQEGRDRRTTAETQFEMFVGD